MQLDKIPQCGTPLNLYSTNGNNSTFLYSDGMESEKYLLETISKAKDLGYASDELQRAIKDWPSEYHLTSMRSNLFRPFPFMKSSRVLELGCGCGAVTRYFAENGMMVDAIEGSYSRSRIAAERCRDLASARIYNINYNDIDFYPSHYDYALLIGVLEYAPMFIGVADYDPVQAVKKVLMNLRQSLKPNGHLIIAIENKLGMKYFSGCHEDHTSIEYDGILGYPSTDKIITFSKKELSDILAECGFKATHFYYPFPDYKLPSTIISSEYMSRARYPENLFARIWFRSYAKERRYRFPELFFSDSLKKAGIIENFANSFLVVAAAEKIGIHSEHEFAYYTNPILKERYRLFIRKDKNENCIKRSLIDKRAYEQKNEGDDCFIFRFSEDKEYSEEYLDGALFYTSIFRSLMRNDSLAEFMGLMRKYYDCLVAYYEKEGEITFAIDFCFWNLMYDGNKFIPFDLKWGIEKKKVNNIIKIIIIRSLFYFIFASNNFRFLGNLRVRHSIDTAKQLIESVFKHLDIMLEPADLETFLELESKLQKQASKNSGERDYKRQFMDLLDAKFPETEEEIFNEWKDIVLLRVLKEQCASQERQLRATEAQLREKDNILQSIHNSRGWKLLVKYYWLRDKFLPASSRRKAWVKRLWKITRSCLPH